MIGTQVGPYRVLAELGRGGMGEVYRAHDSKLARDVALKVLPDAFVADAERLARFEREARALAALNHPNIAQIYGMESGALVMELVEGEDLAAMLKRGAVPLSDALAIARQIASALEAAHDAGIIHRDLKPANIKVRPDGSVKVLDFGLAKAADPMSSSSGSLANSPTITNPATQLGMILGTAAYMSPEQARGRPVDRRADVWAFGVVLYEMLTGARAFQGDDVSDVLASVLKDTIPLGTLPSDTPAPVRRLLRRCLEKDRTQRLDSMATARLEIADALSPSLVDASPGSPTSSTQSTGARRGSRVLIGALAIAGLAIAAYAGSQWSGPATASRGRVAAFTIPFKSERPPTSVAITPAGDEVLIETDRLYRRRLSDLELRPMPGTAGGRNLFLSTDGRWAGFFADGKIKKVALAGGDPLVIGDVDADSPGAAWGPDNTVIYSTGWNSALFSISADGGSTPKAISTVDIATNELGHWWPQTLPGGKTILFTVWMAAAGINDARIAVLDLATGRHRVLQPGAFARYIASSRQLLFFHAGNYHVVPFDLAKLAIVGDSKPVLPDLRPHDPLGTRVKPWSMSDDGTIVYLGGPLTAEGRLSWVTPAGVPTPINLPPRPYRALDLSPDGTRLVVSRIEGGVESMYMIDLARQTEEKFELPGSNYSPLWSPTGDFFSFTMLRKGHFDVGLYRINEGRETRLIEEPFDQDVMGISHDGKRMVVRDYYADGSISLTNMLVDRPNERPKINSPSGVTYAVRLSPDDRWMAAYTLVSGRPQIVVQPFGAPGPAVAISNRGAAYPLWSSKEPKLFYQRGDEIVALTYSGANGSFTIVREDTLFNLLDMSLVGLAPDGRFLIVTRMPGQESEVRVVVGWKGE